MKNFFGIDMSKSNLQRNILQNIMTELGYIVPDIIEAYKDGIIDAAEKTKIETDVVEMVALMFNRHISKESSAKIVEGIMELAKLVGLTK